MRCPMESRQEDLLLAHSSGRLDAARAAPLELHLASCPRCGEFVAGQRAVWSALNEWQAPAVSAGFDQRLYRRIEQRGAGWERWLQPARSLLGWRALPLAAAACLVITAGLVLERPDPVYPPSNSTLEIQHPEQVVHALDDMEMLSDFDRALRTDAPRS